MDDIMLGIVSNYTGFFHFDAFWHVVSDPVCWGVIGTLVMLEGLLSADNALVLAVMVKHLPENDQRKALFYGILGAYAFRFLAIGVGTFLIKIWWIKLIGALYLLWMVVKHFFLGSGQEQKRKNVRAMGFWRTVFAVEVMDIAFSVDSVLAAFGVSDEVWVLYLGGIFGVLMMRGVAQIFLNLIGHYPELETTAFLLISLIGLKMLGSVFHIYISQTVFFSSMLALFLGTFIVHRVRVGKF